MVIRRLGWEAPGGSARLCSTSIETHRRSSAGDKPRASVSPRVLISHFAARLLLASLPPPLGPGRLHTRRGISVGLSPPARSDPGALVSSIAIFPLLFWQETKTCEKIFSLPTAVVTAPFWTANLMRPRSAWSMSCTFHSVVERAARCFPSETTGSSPRKGGLAAKRAHDIATKQAVRTRRPRGLGLSSYGRVGPFATRPLVAASPGPEKERAARERPFLHAAGTGAIRSRPARPPAAAPRGRRP